MFSLALGQPALHPFDCVIQQFWLSTRAGEAAVTAILQHCTIKACVRTCAAAQHMYAEGKSQLEEASLRPWLLSLQ